MQDDEGAMLGIEPIEGSLDEITLREVATRVATRRLIDVEHLDLDGATPTPARLIEAAVDQEAVEPGIEPVRITKSGQVSPGSHQGVLDRVARELRVPKDEARGGVQASSGCRRDQGEGVVIASSCPLDQRPLVHCPSPLARQLLPGHTVWRRARAIRCGKPEGRRSG